MLVKLPPVIFALAVTTFPAHCTPTMFPILAFGAFTCAAVNTLPIVALALTDKLPVTEVAVSLIKTTLGAPLIVIPTFPDEVGIAILDVPLKTVPLRFPIKLVAVMLAPEEILQ